MLVYFNIIIIIIIILIILYIINKNIIKEFFDINEYKKLLLNNNNSEILYKIKLNEFKIYKEDCFDKCNHRECIKLYERIKILDKCLKCNNTKNKCFNKSIIGGTCDDCNIDEYKDKLDCYDVQNFGCSNPDNLNLNKGVEPYYLQIPDNNLNSPYNKKCVFCWNILDNI